MPQTYRRMGRDASQARPVTIRQFGGACLQRRRAHRTSPARVLRRPCQGPPVSARRSGRDEAFTPPPGQNPASGFPAPGSHLGQFGLRSVPWARGGGSRAKEAGSARQSGGFAPVATDRAGFVARASDARCVRPRSGIASRLRSSSGPHNNCHAPSRRVATRHVDQLPARAASFGTPP